MLEKILQEIETLVSEIRKMFPDTSSFPVWSGYESAIDDVEEIIRSHMEDADVVAWMLPPEPYWSDLLQEA